MKFFFAFIIIQAHFVVVFNILHTGWSDKKQSAVSGKLFVVETCGKKNYDQNDQKKTVEYIFYFQDGRQAA